MITQRKLLAVFCPYCLIRKDITDPPQLKMFQSSDGSTYFNRLTGEVSMGKRFFKYTCPTKDCQYEEHHNKLLMFTPE